MKRAPNYIRLALDIRRGHWLVSDADALMPIALDFFSKITPAVESVEFSPMMYSTNGAVADAGGSGKASKQKCVVVLPIHSTLTKYDTCASYGTMSIASELVRLASKDNVVGVVLDIDSGGGACNAIPPMEAAIAKVKQMGKPIVAHCDTCASAAYWIAALCDAVFADNPMSEFGSIGVMSQIIDNRTTASGAKVITVYAKESEDKNLSYRKALDGDYELLQTELSPIVKRFQTAVKLNRPKLDADRKGVLTGGMFLADDAIECGLVNAVLSLEESIENVFARAGEY